MGMKVIIDIPKEAFESVKSDEPIDFLDAMHIISTIQNGIPLEEELEKIRQESVRLTGNKIMATGTRADGRMDIIEIIDKHIEELKGE